MGREGSVMAEETIRSILLIFHNIALVGCAAAPFYNRQLVLRRAPYGPKLNHALDKVVEDTLQGNVPYCIAFIAILWATGILMPLNYFLFNDEFKDLHAVAWVAVGLKLFSVVGMMGIMYVIFFSINPRLRELFATFSPDADPDPEAEKEFFAKRARRKKLCEICLFFALGVLASIAFIAFSP